MIEKRTPNDPFSIVCFYEVAAELFRRLTITEIINIAHSLFIIYWRLESFSF